LPKAQADGNTQLRLTPLELIERLAVLIPPPRMHGHRDHGVLQRISSGTAASGKDAGVLNETESGRQRSSRRSTHLALDVERSHISAACAAGLDALPARYS
jgi:putative transposase